MPSKDYSSFMRKILHPRGKILNDGAIDVDYLGHSVYAEALAETVSNVKTPVTIGVFASWGSGKTFLVNHVCNLLQKKQNQENLKSVSINRPQTTAKFLVKAFGSTFVACIFAALGIIATIPTFFIKKSQTTTDPQHVNETTATSTVGASFSVWQIYSISLLSVTVFFSLLIALILICERGYSAMFVTNLKILAFAAFTRLPIVKTSSAVLCEDDEDIKHVLATEKLQRSNSVNSDVATRQHFLATRYIFVNFNAWAYAGSENLWAGIATKLSDAIEAEFGILTSRVFRSFDIATISRDVDEANPNSNTFFAKFHVKQTSDDCVSVLKDLLKDFGVLKRFACCENSKKSNQNRRDESYNWYEIEYSNYVEAHHAAEYLCKERLDVSWDDPRNSSSKNAIIEIEMKYLGKNKTPEDQQNNSQEENNSTDPNEKLLPEQSKPISQRELGGSSPESDKTISSEGFWSFFKKYPKTACSFPVLFWLILLIFFCLVPIPLTLYASVISKTLPIISKVIASLPATIALISAAFNFIWAMSHSQTNRITSALAGTKKSMAGALGLMDKIKYEIDVITKLVRCAEIAHKQHYKVVITIDDLDRIPLSKVKSILEAVNILLSDRSSPFVCIIAVDSRIAVRCIEEGMGETLLQSNIGGHEYLKKIINLPFCLPQAGKKKQFIEGLINQADIVERIPKYPMNEGNVHANDDVVDGRVVETEDPQSNVGGNDLYHVEDEEDEENEEPNTLVVSDAVIHRRDQADSVPAGQGKRLDKVESEPFSENTNSTHPDVHEKMSCCVSATTESEEDEASLDKPLDENLFLYKCREFLQNDQTISQHLQANPRSIKRIFNVISLTSVIISCKEHETRKRKFLKETMSTDETNDEHVGTTGNSSDKQHTKSPFSLEKGIRSTRLAKDLVRWIVLTDQWPYRTTYMVQVIEDADQRVMAGRNKENIPDNLCLYKLFRKYVEPELLQVDQQGNRLLNVDGDQDLFYSFLLKLCKKVTKRKVKTLLQFTINLDQSLRQSIAFRREIFDMKRYGTSAKEVETTDKKVSGESRISSLPHRNPTPEAVSVQSKVSPEQQRSKSINDSGTFQSDCAVSQKNRPSGGSVLKSVNDNWHRQLPASSLAASNESSRT